MNVKDKKVINNMPIDTAFLALNGNELGYEILLSYYDKYLNKLALKKEKYEYFETEYFYVDEDIKQVLQIAVIKASKEFVKLLLKKKKQF